MVKKFDFTSTKMRTMIIFGSAILLAIVVIVAFIARKPNPLQTAESHTSKIPQITAIPGNVTSEKYQELQEEDNRRRAQQAKTTGGSAVATIIGTKDKDALAKKESFGIEGDLLKAPCPCTPDTKKPCDGTEYNKEFVDKLTVQMEAAPTSAATVMQQNPCFAKALCSQHPDLALKAIENNKEAAKIMLKECPDMATALAEKNPALFKQLMLENPDLAKKITALHPEILKKLMSSDPDFAKKIASVNPDLMKTLMKNDPDFIETLSKQNPEMIKTLMKSDPELTKALAKSNPGLVKKLMLSDPEFAKTLATTNPDVVKELMKNDPAFANQLATSNPTLVKELMKNDPVFADIMGKNNPEMVKKLMLDDPEFAKIMAKNNPEMVNTLIENDPTFKRALHTLIPDIDKIITANLGRTLSPQDRSLTLEQSRHQQKEAMANRARQAQISEQQQKKIDALVASMESQSKNFYQNWAETSNQQFVQGQKKDNKGSDDSSSGSGSSGSSSSGQAAASSGKVLIKAGTILFASLDTAVNSDEPGPIMATVTQGTYKGAKILGSVQLASTAGSDRPEKVTLNFSTLNILESEKSLTINGVAIDPDTARTALASNVDHHYLLRYGTMFASSFMSGYAKIIASQGTVQTSTIAGNTTTTTPALSPRQEIFAALGEVGTRFGNATSSYFTLPNTITVNAGTGFGLLVLADVTNSP
jgi:type IV secretory pathway VirB10-like protein